MTLKESLIIKKILETAYPTTYQKTDDSVFYAMICNFDFKKMQKCVYDFCSKNKFPPTFADLKSTYEIMFITGEEVWEWAKELNEQFPYTKNDFYRNRFLQEISKNLKAYKIFEEMISNSQTNIFDEDSEFDFDKFGIKLLIGYEYRRNHFLKNYNSKCKLSGKELVHEERRDEKCLN